MDPDQPKRILIIDDSEQLCAALARLFRSEGYAVSTAENGQVGLGAVRTFRPDLVIVDVVMPVMDGLEFMLHLRSDFAPPLPPVIVCSGFGSAEASALAAGAYAFVLKPTSAHEIIELVASALAHGTPDPALLEQGRDAALRARSEVAAAADGALRSRPLEDLIRSVRELLSFVRGYFGADDAFAAVLRNDVLTIVSSGGPTRESPRTDTSIGEIILTGSTLVLPDISKHAAFARDLEHLPSLRSFVGVPVVTRSGATVGAICLARNREDPFSQEDVLILRSGGRRAARLIERVSAGEADPFRDFPFLVTGAALARETFHLIVEMELRLAAHAHESVELALVDAAAAISPAAIQAAQRAVDPRRWAIGERGARRIAFFKRAADAGDVRRQVEAATDALRSLVPLSGVGSVAVDGGAVGVLDAPMLFQLADRELAAGRGSGHLERLMLAPAPASSLRV